MITKANVYFMYAGCNYQIDKSVCVIRIRKIKKLKGYIHMSGYL